MPRALVPYGPLLSCRPTARARRGMTACSMFTEKGTSVSQRVPAAYDRAGSGDRIWSREILGDRVETERRAIGSTKAGGGASRALGSVSPASGIEIHGCTKRYKLERSVRRSIQMTALPPPPQSS